jgi:hypothetical protein
MARRGRYDKRKHPDAPTVANDDPESIRAYQKWYRDNVVALKGPQPTHPNPGQCEICDRLESESKNRSLHRDHDHETGIFRGWLCTRCNVALGLFEDNPFVLRLAANYLEQGRSK